MAHTKSVCLIFIAAVSFTSSVSRHGLEQVLLDEDECSANEHSKDCALGALQLRAAKEPILGVAEEDLIMGVSYGPMPCKGQCAIHMDDFMGEPAKPLWGQRGRSDLQVIRDLGANMVRLYGNSPDVDHGSFMDEALKVGLGVTIGMSDYPYTQMQNSCMQTGFDCSEQIKGVYSLNLAKGFLTDGKQYHPSLKHVIVINEPDLKLPGMAEPKKFAKGIISGLDGMLEAEKEAGITGPLPNFTATVSFGVCPLCKKYGKQPAMGQMAEIREAMLNPAAYGYTPKNDLAKVYHTRWLNSFNTNAPADYIESSFVKPYEETFPGTPVVIEEFHTPGKNPKDDLALMMKTARESNLMLGVSFFEFQKRYDKGGTEAAFGMFGLGEFSVNEFNYYGDNFSSFCLTPIKTQYGDVPSLVAEAYGGKKPNYKKLCQADPSKVPLTAAGYVQIQSQGVDSVAEFAARVAMHLTGHTGAKSELKASIEKMIKSPSSFDELTKELKDSSVGTSAEDSQCVADRLAFADRVGEAIGEACNNMTSFNCSLDLPTSCKGSVWSTADYVFTQFFKEKGGDPLTNCYFQGAAILADKSYVGRQCGQECCSYKGSEAPLPTVAPTLPPVFVTSPPNAGPATNPAPPPAFAGDCSFGEQPSIQYFWDKSCAPSGGAGCKADGKHMECRYCGKEGFPACPTAAGDKTHTEQPAPAPSRSDETGCNFKNSPTVKYFWDTSCKEKGGMGCMADGENIECRYCGGRFPACP